MSDDDETPVRKISTHALSVAAIVAEDLIGHLKRSAWSHDQDAPAGFVERIAHWMAREEVSRRSLVRERDELQERLEQVERERDRLASLMREV